jgi:GTP-binding protein LepA
VTVTILTPTDYVGTLMELAQQRRGEMQKMEYLSDDRVELVYTLPLGEIVLDFFDQMKSRTRGYASLDYEPAGYRRPNLVEGRRAAQQRARRRVLADRAPRQGVRRTGADDREAARAHPAPAVRRADPGRDRRAHHRPRDGEGEAQGRLAKCYGGDITRKRKLLERQKEGKKR